MVLPTENLAAGNPRNTGTPDVIQTFELCDGSPCSPNFWTILPRPIFGLSPMDGVTNAAFRYVTARVGTPDITYTEFVPVEGLTHGAVRLLDDFRYDDIERPIIAQIYGSNPQTFYAAAHLVCALGFDGIDINMGCPAKNVAHRGAGAGLIRTPNIAQAIVRATRQGVADWCAGQPLSDAGLPEVIVKACAAIRATQRAHLLSHRTKENATLRAEDSERDAKFPIPVSVKTRIGYSANDIDTWIPALLEVAPAALAVHGRTLTQLYRGHADWDAIARVVELARPHGVPVLGNGDVLHTAEAWQRIAQTGVDGVLIGRGAMGNPWMFSALRAEREKRTQPTAQNSGAHHVIQHTEFCDVSPNFPSVLTRITTLLDHAEQLLRLHPPKAFHQIKRLVKPYTLGLPDVQAARDALVRAKTPEEFLSIARALHAESVVDVRDATPCTVELT